MTEVQIAILAREYAEWMIKDAKVEDLPNCLKRTMLVSNTEYAGEVFHWLLNRYYIVEKHKVQDEYDEARTFCENVAPCGESYARNETRMFLLERLFPALGKEVEK